MSIENIHLSIHIERTGGTSLLSALEKLYTPHQLLIYKAGKDKLIRLSDIPISPASEKLSKLKHFLEGTPVLHAIYKLYTKVTENDETIFNWIDVEDIPEDTAAIHGHFSLDRFDGLVENPFVTVMLREPLERMVSQYLHWRRAGGTLGWRVEIPFDEATTFEEYALRADFANFQTQALGGKPLEEFDIVGVTHRHKRFIRQLQNKKKKKRIFSKLSLNSLSKKPKYAELGITEEIIQRFKEFNEVDYKNYNIAKQLAGVR